ncbi:hypothetical protein EDD16DRAFT_1515393 [Pisolithus croceorrhizus]|nr:hypothetical protein EDD16DRAFT_1515393 [Pisolithus croceorrhizus]
MCALPWCTLSLCLLFTIGLSSSMPRAKHMKGMVQCNPDSMGDTGVPSSSHEQTALTLQRTRQTTAGQGGAIMQLKKVGDVLAQPQQTPKQWVVLPDDTPQNILALTPRCQRRVTQASQKGQKHKTHTTENHTEDLAVEMNLDSGPLPEFQMVESGSRFGFHTQTPKQPSFIETQSLNKHLKLQILLPLEHKVGLLCLRQLPPPSLNPSSLACPKIVWLLSPLSMVPEVLSTSSTPDPFMSWAASITLSGSSKRTTKKNSFKPSQTKHEESCDSNVGPWSSLDDAGDAEDAEDEAPCGCAGSNDVPDSNCMSEDAEPHEVDDKLGLGGQTPSPQCLPSLLPPRNMSLSVQHPCSLVLLLLSSLVAYILDLPDHKLHLNMLWLPHCLNVEKVSPCISLVGVDYDVSARHQSQNHHSCPPSPTYLAGTGSGEKHCSTKLHSNVVSHVQGRLHSEEDCSGDSSSLVAFFSPLWCKLLDEAKGRMQLYVATEVLFLHHEMAINSVCMEILVEMVIKYEDNGLELEAGFYPEHKRSMAMIVDQREEIGGSAASS